MGTSVYLAAHPQKEIFEIGGSWMLNLTAEDCLYRSHLLSKITTLLDSGPEYCEWLCEKMGSMCEKAKWDISIIGEGGYDTLICERQYKRVGTYFPLR